jgi:hypothetical protein
MGNSTLDPANVTTTSIAAIEAAAMPANKTTVSLADKIAATVTGEKPVVTMLGPFVIVYSAQSRNGRTAEPVSRTVYIDTSCKDPLDFRCPNGACSIMSVCTDIIPDLVHEDEHGPEFIPVHDGEPPDLTMLGDPPVHRLARSDSTGQIVMLTTLEVGAVWVDAGCTAVDVVDGNVPVTSVGVGAVTTLRPTAPNHPWLVRLTDLPLSVFPAVSRRTDYLRMTPQHRQFAEYSG